MAARRRLARGSNRLRAVPAAHPRVSEARGCSTKQPVIRVGLKRRQTAKGAETKRRQGKMIGSKRSRKEMKIIVADLNEIDSTKPIGLGTGQTGRLYVK